MKNGNVIKLNLLHLNSCHFNGTEKVQKGSVGGGSIVIPPPTEPDIPPTYTLSASVTNGKVSAKRNGSAVNLPYTANEGDVIVVSVTPNDGYTFEGWNDGNTDNPRSITMNADVVLSAQCVEVVVPPAKDYIQFEDAEVERVLMSKGVSSDGIGITIEDAEKVTSISTWFKGNTAITSFEEFKYFKNCTSLEASAFDGCSALNTLSFPSSITSIGSSACRNVPAPMVLNLPNLRTIGTAAFYGSGLTEIRDLGKVSVIGTATAVVSSSQGAFADCKALTKVHIPSSVTHIGGMSFIGCDALTSVSGCEGVTNIVRQQAFDRCSALVGELILPSIKVVDQYSFRNCGLTKVDLGADATTIAAYAFQNNTAMTAFICRATTPPSLANTNAFSNTNNCPIYVPDASLEAYKTAVNWSAYADRIHPLSEIEGSLVFYDKLVGDGTAYINTEYYPTSWDNVEWDADAPSVYNKYVFGCKSSVLSVANLVYSAAQTYYNYKPSTSATTINEDNAKRQKRTLRIVDLGDGSYRREVADLDSGVVNVIDAGWSGKDVVATNALRVFCSTTSAGANEKFYKGAIRSLVITDAKTGNTIMSLRPCTFAGEAGMWDEVGNKFYGNAATSGEFSVAND